MNYDFTKYHKENNAHIYAYSEWTYEPIEYMGFIYADNLTEANEVLRASNRAWSSNDMLLIIPEESCCKEMERRATVNLQKKIKDGVASGLSESDAEEIAKKQVDKEIEEARKACKPFDRYMAAKTGDKGNTK